MTAYPIDPLLPRLCEALQPGSTVLLQAPPGAGKTTRVPLALLGALGPMGDNRIREGRIWMIEPRRLAARAAASRLAETLGESVGERVGFSVRGEQQRSAQTQVEVITDGLFLRRLQADPALNGVAVVLFDEFHERRRDADLAFALLQEARPLLQPELAVMLMSATLDLSDLQNRLPEAAVLESEGRAHPVETVHQLPRRDEALPRQVLRAIETHAIELPARSGVLVFLPGLAEIIRCKELLETAGYLRRWRILPLHGQLPLEEQNRALQRCSADHDGTVILASAIAESSVTIDGVRLVIDSGLSRQLRYDPGQGMEGLETVPSSLASADQRRGRAGRQGPGCCVRLWSPAEQQRRPAFSTPELQLADPQPVVLELAAWGAGLGEELPWLEPPPAASLLEGQQQLIALGVLTTDGRLSPSGRLLGQLGTHPRLGVLMLEAHRRGCPELGCDLAALLSERDPLRLRDSGCDLHARLEALKRERRLAPLRQLSRQLRRQLEALKLDPPDDQPEQDASRLILAAFPGWLALQRPGQPGRYRLRQGRGADLVPHDPLTGAEALAVARVDLGSRETRIQLAVAISDATLQSLAAQEGQWQDSAHWDAAAARIRARRRLMLGHLTIREDALPTPDGLQCRDLLLELLAESRRLDWLPWTDALQQLCRRQDLAHRHLGAPWPQRTPEALLATAEHWLGPVLIGCLRWQDLDPTTLENALWTDLEWGHRQQLETLLPRQVPIPSGRCAALRYEEDEVVLAVKLQEMFGCADSPQLLDGRLPVTLELLSPAGRPLQRTCDLAGFWSGSYADVRRDMRGRYPKHPWPEDPRQAIPTARTKRRPSRPN